MGIIVNLVIAGLILGMTWALMSEGLWGAALMFFNVLFAGLLAFNFYEPLAALLDSTGIGWGFSDTLCLLGIFLAAVNLLRLTTETIAPSMVRFPPPVYHIGRVGFGLATSVMTFAILLVAFETAPVHKKVFQVIDYKTEVPFGIGIDREWLAFFQYTTGQVFASHAAGTRDPFKEYGDAKVFDPRSEWLLIHQDARPYGDKKQNVLGEEESADTAAGGAVPAPGGSAPGAMPGAMPGSSSSNSNASDPKVVGPAVGGGVVLPQ